MNENISYVTNENLKQITIQFTQDFEILQDYDNNVDLNTDEVDIFNKKQTECHFFDDTIVSEVPFQQQVAKTEQFVKYEQMEIGSEIKWQSNAKYKVIKPGKAGETNSPRYIKRRKSDE